MLMPIKSDQSHNFHNHNHRHKVAEERRKKHLQNYRINMLWMVFHYLYNSSCGHCKAYGEQKEAHCNGQRQIIVKIKFYEHFQWIVTIPIVHFALCGYAQGQYSIHVSASTQWMHSMLSRQNDCCYKSITLITENKIIELLSVDSVCRFHFIFCLLLTLVECLIKTFDACEAKQRN